MWEAVYAPTFLKDLRSLPKPARDRVERVAFGQAILEDPYLGGRVQSVIGHPGFYKLRVEVITGLAWRSTPGVVSSSFVESCIGGTFVGCSHSDRGGCEAWS